jgi:pyrrolidone-carboxylate peptidase
VIPILLTGFGRWDDIQYNASGVVARRLDGAIVSGAEYGAALEGRVHARVLDVAWGRGEDPDGARVEAAARTLAREVAIHKPRILLSLGVIPEDPDGIDVEYEADDRSDTTALDVRSRTPSTPRLHTRWPRRLVMPLPQRPLVEALKAEGYGAYSERGLGRFLCERAAYEGARLARLKGTSLLRAGFVHVFNPMVRAIARDRGKEAYAVVPSELDEDEKVALARAEAELDRAVRIALGVCLGSLPPDVETRPERWRYLDAWRPEFRGRS